MDFEKEVAQLREWFASPRFAGIRRVHALILAGNRDAAQFWNAVGWRMREDLTVVSAEMEALPVN